MLEEFRYVSHFRTAFHDFDYLQHVNNIAYITWTETLRCAYFADVIGEAIDGERGWIMATQSFEYLAPIQYLEHVSVGGRISRVGTKSIEMMFEIWNATTGVFSARGLNTLVAFDYGAGTSIPVPVAWREKLRAYEIVAPLESSQTAS